MSDAFPVRTTLAPAPRMPSLATARVREVSNLAFKTVAVVNPAAAAGSAGRRWQRWRKFLAAACGATDTVFTTGLGHATAVTRRAIEEGAERIVVVGGDGTLNEVVNGFFTPEGESIAGDEVTLVLIPAGTGGDFARSTGTRGCSVEQIFHESSVQRVDLGRVELTQSDGRPLMRHFINISSFGMSGLVVSMVNRTTKRFGATASFLWGTLRGLLQSEIQPVRLHIDGARHVDVSTRTVAVANGRYFGGAMKIAPHALINDGCFDVIVVGDIGLAAFAGLSRKLYRGEHLGDPRIEHFRAREIIAEPLGKDEVLVEVDGEQPGKLPARYRIMPSALRVLSPWGRAEALAISSGGPTS